MVLPETGTTVFAPVRTVCLVRRFKKDELFALFAQCELFALFPQYELYALFVVRMFRTVRRSHCSHNMNCSYCLFFELFALCELFGLFAVHKMRTVRTVRSIVRLTVRRSHCSHGLNCSHCSSFALFEQFTRKIILYLYYFSGSKFQSWIDCIFRQYFQK